MDLVKHIEDNVLIGDLEDYLMDIYYGCTPNTSNNVHELLSTYDITVVESYYCEGTAQVRELLIAKDDISYIAKMFTDSYDESGFYSSFKNSFYRVEPTTVLKTVYKKIL